MFVEKIDEMMDKKRRLFPCRSNRASSMGHPCARYLYYCRMNWEDRGLPDLALQYIFDIGNEHEKILIRRLLEANVEVSHQQQGYEMKDLEITGHIDGKLSDGKTLYPFDAKSMHQHIWSGINDIYDMINHKSAHVRAYPGQLQLYLLMGEHDKGLFIIIDKQTSQSKEIWMELDLAYCETLLKKAELVNECIKTKTVPDRMPYNPNDCDRCAFAHLCLQAVENRDNVFLEYSDEIAHKLDQREQHAFASKLYDNVDKEIKDWAKKISQDMIIAGSWCIIKSTSKNGAVRCNISRLSEKEI